MLATDHEDDEDSVPVTTPPPSGDHRTGAGSRVASEHPAEPLGDDHEGHHDDWEDDDDWD